MVEEGLKLAARPSRQPTRGLVRRFDRLEHDLRVGGLGKRLGDMVAPVALVRVVSEAGGRGVPFQRPKFSP
jgi:hypothetical protein